MVNLPNSLTWIHPAQIVKMEIEQNHYVHTTVYESKIDSIRNSSLHLKSVQSAYDVDIANRNYIESSIRIEGVWYTNEDLYLELILHMPDELHRISLPTLSKEFAIDSDTLTVVTIKYDDFSRESIISHFYKFIEENNLKGLLKVTNDPNRLTKLL